MLGMQLLESHVARLLQLGPPSVAKITAVLPGSRLNVGMSAVSEAAVGVAPKTPPDDRTAVAKPFVTGPSPQLPLGRASPGCVGKTSSPTAHGFISLTA